MGLSKNLLVIGAVVSLIASPAFAASAGPRASTASTSHTAPAGARVGTLVTQSENLHGRGTLLLLLLGIGAAIGLGVGLSGGSPKSP